MTYQLKSTIHSNQFMLVTENKRTGDLFIPQDPQIFSTYPSALHKAQELASQYRENKYIVVAVAAVAQAIENPVVITSYKL